MSLALLFEECFIEIVQVQSGQARKSPQPEILRLFAEIQSRNQNQSLGYGDWIHLAKFAIAALADETAASAAERFTAEAKASAAKGRVDEEAAAKAAAAEMRSCRLVNHIAKNEAGTVATNFYDILKRLEGHEKILTDPKVGQTLEVYCLCLLLGYRGSLAHDPNGLSQTTDRVTGKVEELLGKKPRLSVGEMHFAEPAAKTYDPIVRWVAAAIPLTVVMALVYILYSS